MQQIKTPVVYADRMGRIRYLNAAAKRFGFAQQEQITVASDELPLYDSLWDGKDRTYIIRAEAGGSPCRALVGVRSYEGERLAVWVFFACLQLKELNILFPSISTVYRSVGGELIDFVFSQTPDELPTGETAGGRTAASLHRIEMIQGYMGQITTRMAQRNPMQLDHESIRYRMHRVLALFRLMAVEALPQSGYHVTFDDASLPYVPDAPVPFWPLAVAVTAMLTFSLEISQERCAHISYHMDELSFIFEVSVPVRISLPDIDGSHAFARLGMRYPDLYPDLLFAVRLAETLGWSVTYNVNENAADNFKLTLSLDLPDPFVCFLRMPVSEPDYDREFLELLQLLLCHLL